MACLDSSSLILPPLHTSRTASFPPSPSFKTLISIDNVRSSRSIIARCLDLHSYQPACLRRSFLLTLALALFRPLDSCAGADEFVDPLEQALVNTLDARDSLPLLCEYINRFQSDSGSNTDLQTPTRTLVGIYESLELSLPKLVEQFELEEDSVQELLSNLAYAQDAFRRSCLASSPTYGLEDCVKLLKLASVQVDDLLDQLPTETIESVQLIRGVRPTA